MVTVKAAAEITGLTVKSIRFYEKKGLVTPVARSPAGYRLYTEEDIFRLQQIRFYREQEFTLEEVAEIFSSSDRALRSMLKQQLYKIENRIQELEHVRSTLSNALAMSSCGTALTQEEEKYRLERRHTAIVGIDLQNDFLDGGSLPCKRIYNIIPPLEQFFGRAREEKIPIIYVCDSHHKGDPELDIWADHAIAGTWGAQVIDALSPQPQDRVIKKSCFNGFLKTDLQKTLKKLMVDTIILVGWRTHVCVSQTAIEAFYQGYRVFVAQDCVDSTTQAEQEFGLNLLRVNYEIPILPWQTILDCIDTSEQQG
ncbi:MAG: isochorismatase family protein [Pseudoflavonifractor sp.]